MYVCYFLPLEMGVALHLYKLESSFSKGLVEIGLVVLKKTADKGHSLHGPSAKASLKPPI